MFNEVNVTTVCCVIYYIPWYGQLEGENYVFFNWVETKSFMLFVLVDWPLHILVLNCWVISIWCNPWELNGNTIWDKWVHAGMLFLWKSPIYSILNMFNEVSMTTMCCVIYCAMIWTTRRCENYTCLNWAETKSFMLIVLVDWLVHISVLICWVPLHMLYRLFCNFN
jgi:hypothetical protein